MSPALQAGQVIVVTGRFDHVQVGDVVVVRHNGLDKVKRIAQLNPLKGVFVLGDNTAESLDSRSFGWLDFDEIVAKVVWPRRK